MSARLSRRVALPFALLRGYTSSTSSSRPPSCNVFLASCSPLSSLSFLDCQPVSTGAIPKFDHSLNPNSILPSVKGAASTSSTRGASNPTGLSTLAAFFASSNLSSSRGNRSFSTGGGGGTKGGGVAGGPDQGSGYKWRDWIAEKISDEDEQAQAHTNLAKVELRATEVEEKSEEEVRAEALMRSNFSNYTGSLSGSSGGEKPSNVRMQRHEATASAKKLSAESDAFDELDELLGMDNVEGGEEMLGMDIFGEEEEHVSDGVESALSRMKEMGVTSDAALKAIKVFDLEDEESNGAPGFRFRSDRLFYPGQEYELEDLDISVPSVEVRQMRAPKVHNKNEVLQRADFRNVRYLAQFITETAKVQHRTKSKLAAKAQRKVAKEIRTARAFGLMPFTLIGRPPFRFTRVEEVAAASVPIEEIDVDFPLADAMPI